MNKFNPSDISISQNQYTVFELYNMVKDCYIVFPRRFNLFRQYTKKYVNREYINWYNNDTYIHFSNN